MPRVYKKTEPKHSSTIIHVVWTDKPGYTKIFTDRMVADRYAVKQRKYSNMVQFKSHNNLAAANNWITAQNHQFNSIRQQIYNPSSAAIDVSAELKGPLETLLEEQANCHPPMLRACIFFADGSKKPNLNATVGLLCKQLGIAETIKLSAEHNHQSAELSGIVFSLEAFLVELEKNCETANPFDRVVCVSDSDYAVKTMKKWVHDWIGKFGENELWYTTRKEPVKFTDIIKRNLSLERQITAKGVKVEYLWVPRESNTEADALSNGKTLPKEAYTELPSNYTLAEWEELCKAAPTTEEAAGQ